MYKRQLIATAVSINASAATAIFFCVIFSPLGLKTFQNQFFVRRVLEEVLMFAQKFLGTLSGFQGSHVVY